MSAPRPKRIAKKRKSDPVRVVAVRHPPTGNVSAQALRTPSPYITNHGYAKLFREIAKLVPADLNSTSARPEQLAAVGEKVLKFLEVHEPRLTDAQRPVFAVVVLSLFQEKLYGGAYAATKRNPLYAIEAFVTFQHLGLYPPLWVLKWLNEAFTAYLQSGDGTSLEALLGVKRKKGQTPIFKEASATHTESAIMREIGVLTILGIPIEHAAYMAEERLRSKKIKCPGAETLASRFVKRGWNWMFKPMKAATIPPDVRKEILAAYPGETIPPKYR